MLSSLHTADDVISAVRRLSAKTSAADPLPTSILKMVIDVIGLFIAELFTRSMATGEFPTVFKETSSDQKARTGRR